MTSEDRTCQNCKQQFSIEPADFDFYEKISVPPPTFCPKCRRQRRMGFINFTNLFKRTCGLCGKEALSKYPPEATLVTYCVECYYSDKWDALDFGREYDFSRPFFEQFKELLQQTPVLILDIDPVAAQYSPFVNHAGSVKNCYLVFFSAWSEECLYGFYLAHDQYLVDCSLAMFCDFCYDSRNMFKNNKCIGVENTTESIDCLFLRDSSNCQNCFASANLKNKKYYIFNKPYTKEEYFAEIKKWDLGSYAAYQEIKKRAAEHWKNFPPMPIYDSLSVNSTGNYIFESKNCKECYEVTGAEDSKYLMMMIRGPVRECYDITGWGDNLSLSYEGYVGTDASNVRFCMETNIGSMIDGEYFILSSSQNIFGCVSVRQKKYCILNKQYTEDEFQNLRKKIIEHMNSMPYIDAMGNTYRYGEFFPIELSWCAYNETIANLFFPLNKEEALKRGYTWRETPRATQRTTLRAEELPDHINDAPSEVTKETISCKTCTRAYRIIPQEFQFLKNMSLPLPRQCPFCRIESRVKEWVKNMRINNRTCGKCGNSFSTPYTAEDAPHILCKKCYLESVI